MLKLNANERITGYLIDLIYLVIELAYDLNLPVLQYLIHPNTLVK